MVLKPEKWYGIVPNGTKCRMVPNGAEWGLMVPNGTEWCQMVPNGVELFRMVHRVTFTIYSAYIYDTFRKNTGTSWNFLNIHETFRLNSWHIQIRLMWLLDCIYILFYWYLNNSEWCPFVPKHSSNIHQTFRNFLIKLYILMRHSGDIQETFWRHSGYIQMKLMELPNLTKKVLPPLW